MNRASTFRAALFSVVTAIALSACGGGGGGSAASPPVVPPAPTATPVATTAAVDVDIVLQSVVTASKAAQRPRYYVPAQTKSASIVVSAGGTGSPPVVVNCTNQCSTRLNAPLGADTFTVVLFDQPNAAGNALLAGVTPLTVVAGANVLTPKLGGVVARTALNLAPTGIPAGTAATVRLGLTAWDADGNVIQGIEPFADAAGRPAPVPLTIANDAAGGGGAFTASAGAFDGTGSITASYNGGAMNGATFSAGTSTQHVAVWPTVVAEYPVPNAHLSHQLIVGPDGNFWFTSDTSHVGTMTPSGVATLYPLPGGNSASSFTGMTVGPDGNIWTIRDHTMFVVDVRGNVVSQMPLSPSGLFGNPVSAGDGAVWFADGEISALDRMTPAGAITSFPLGAQGANTIAVGPDHNLWITMLHAIVRAGLDGNTTTFPMPAGSGLPLNIVPGVDGTLWFFEANPQYVDRLGKITPAGAITEFPGAPNHQGATTANFSSDMVAGPDGTVWYTESLSGFIARVTPDGIVTESFVPDRTASLYGITVGPDHNIWFAEAPGKIGKLIW